MKLAEALALRSDQKKRMAAYAERLARSAKVQQGDRPPEDPATLLKEFDALASDHEALIEKINRTNLAVRLADGRTLTAAIAARDVLLMRLSTYRRLMSDAAVAGIRGTRTEIKIVPTVDIAKLQRETDAMSKAHRELDTAIQAANWTADLLD